MSIITKPNSIQKGVSALFSLSISELAALPEVIADDYFSDTANWSEVMVVYKSSVGRQYESVEFNTTVSNPTASFLVSTHAKDIFQIQLINIVDFDGGIFTIHRSALNAIEFDIDMTPDTDTIDNNPTGELQYMYYLLGLTPYDRHDISNSNARTLIYGQSVILPSPVTISTVTFKMQRKPETMGGITYETMQGRIYLSILAGEELVGVMLADSSPIECMSMSTSISDVTFTLLAPVNLPAGTYTLRLEGEHIIGNSYTPNGAWIKGYGFPSGATDGGALMGWGDNSQTGIYVYKYRTMSYYYLIN